MRVKARTDGADFKATPIAATHHFSLRSIAWTAGAKDVQGFALAIDRVAWGFVIESRLSPGVRNH